MNQAHLEKLHKWTNHYTPRKGTRAQGFGSPWWAESEYCEPTCDKHVRWKLKPKCHHCKKPGQYKKRRRQLKKQKNQPITLLMVLGTDTVVPTILSPIRAILTPIPTTTTVTEPKESQRLLTHPLRLVENQNTPQEGAIMEPMQPIDCPSGT